jgi:hypothetical protein
MREVEDLKTILRAFRPLKVAIQLFNAVHPSGESDYSCQLLDEAHNALKKRLKEVENGND